MGKTEDNIHVDHVAVLKEIDDQSSSLYQDVSHSFDMSVSIISSCYCLVSTRVRVVRDSCSTKPDPGVTGHAVVFIVPKDTNSCCSQRVIRECPLNVKSLLIAFGLQGSLRPNQRLPRNSTKCGVAILPVSYEGVERISHFIYGDKTCFFLALNPHTETNLGK